MCVQEHPEAPCYTVRRPTKKAEAVFGVAEDPDAQELHELKVIADWLLTGC